MRSWPAIFLMLACGCAMTHERRHLPGDAAAPFDAPVVPTPSDGGALLDARADACAASLERCDGRDQDCDGRVDEGASLDCDFPHATVACAEGSCALAACEPGWSDCDDEQANGCEVDVTSDRASCGACGVPCALSERCDAGVCVRENIVDLDLGSVQACVVLASGRVLCWGSSEPTASLGDGRSTHSAAPVEVHGVSDAVSVAVGASDACVVHATGRISCWGHNNWGQLGDGTDVDRALPVEIAGLSDIVALDRDSSSCAVHRSGTVSCWGWDFRRLIGEGVYSWRPTHILGVEGIVGVSAGSAAMFLLAREGGVSAMGGGGGARLGGPAGPAYHANFVAMPDWTSVRAIALQGGHGCAIRGSNELWCWGGDDRGQLGDGEPTARPSSLDAQPSRVPLADVIDVDVGGGRGHTCALVGSGHVLCWGDNTYGALGRRGIALSATPLPVLGIERAIDIETSSAGTCATLEGGRLRCWGTIAGSLAPGYRWEPTAIVGFE